MIRRKKMIPFHYGVYGLRGNNGGRGGAPQKIPSIFTIQKKKKYILFFFLL